MTIVAAGVSTKAASLTLSFQGKHNSISVGKDVVRVLGVPSYVCIRISEKKDSIAIMPCEPADFMSFRVPDKLLSDHHCVFRIHSKEFVHGILARQGIDLDNSFVVTGNLCQKNNVVMFHLNNENAGI